MEYTQSIIRGRGYTVITPRFSMDGAECINKFYNSLEAAAVGYFDEICGGGCYCRADFVLQSDGRRISVRFTMIRRRAGAGFRLSRREFEHVWVCPYGDWVLERRRKKIPGFIIKFRPLKKF